MKKVISFLLFICIFLFAGCQKDNIIEITGENAAEIVKAFLRYNYSQEFIDTITNLDNPAVEKLAFDSEYIVEFKDNQDNSHHMNTLEGKKVWEITYDTPLIQSDNSLKIYVDLYSGEMYGNRPIDPSDYNDILYHEGIFTAEGYGCVPWTKKSEFYPSVYYNGEKYYWVGFSRNNLPLIYEYEYEVLGDIVYIGDYETTGDLQFNGGRYASGTAYFCKEEPDFIYVYMTTEDFTNKYIVFDKLYFIKYPSYE